MLKHRPEVLGIKCTVIAALLALPIVASCSGGGNDDPEGDASDENGAGGGREGAAASDDDDDREDDDRDDDDRDDDDLLSRKVENCDQAETVGEVEQVIINSRCGDSGCHATTSYGKYKSTKTRSWTADYLGAKAKKPKLYCKGEKIIDQENPKDSLFLRKLERSPTCADNTTTAGEPMPYQKDLLDDETRTCLEQYIKAIVAK